jgi:carbonic anhydrase
MDSIDDLLQRNRSYAASLAGTGAAAGTGQPARRVAVLTCMDARLDVFRMLGLSAGEAHVIRNAGGVASEDAIRSLAISQRLLGTTSIMVVHHTGCGMLTFSDDVLKARIEAETGIRPPFALEAFPDLEGDVRQTMARIAASPFLPHKHMRGFVYEVATGLLREVPA